MPTENAPHGHPHPLAPVEPLHGHPHTHDASPPHAHPHQHPSEDDGGGAHGHSGTHSELPLIVSPVHALDPRVKVLATLLLVAAVVFPRAPDVTEFCVFWAGATLIALIARLPLPRVFVRTLVVIPFAGAIALLAPFTTPAGGLSLAAAARPEGWLSAWTVLSKAWMCTACVMLLSATTTPAALIAALRALHVPDVFITLLSFISRYADVLSGQLLSLRRALASRGALLGRRRTVRILGNLAGNLFIRSYERGERVHAAMLARGYSGRLPGATLARLGIREAIALIVVLTASAALALY